MKKARQFDSIPRLANDFCQPHSSPTHSCYATGMTRTTTSVSTAQLLIFLLKPFSCFRCTRKNSCICLLMQTRRKWRHFASGTHLDRASYPVKCRVLSRVLSHCHVQYLSSICGNCFLVGIFNVQETQQLERYWNSLLSSTLKKYFLAWQLIDGPTPPVVLVFSLLILLNC